MDALEATGGMNWGAWAAGIGDKLITAAIDAEVRNPQELEKLKIERLGTLGYYTEGAPGVGATVAGVPVGLLLIGGAALALWLVLGR